jgi:hypothetical protein
MRSSVVPEVEFFLSNRSANRSRCCPEKKVFGRLTTFAGIFHPPYFEELSIRAPRAVLHDFLQEKNTSTRL